MVSVSFQFVMRVPKLSLLARKTAKSLTNGLNENGHEWDLSTGGMDFNKIYTREVFYLLDTLNAYLSLSPTAMSIQRHFSICLPDDDFNG